MSVTFDPAKINADITLSNGNLTSTKTSGAIDPAGSLAVSTVSKSTGKWYVEFTPLVSASAESVAIGLCNGSATATDWLGKTANSLGLYSDGAGYRSGAGAFTAPSFTAGSHVMGLAFDVDNGLFWFKNLTTASGWNAGGTADPATGVGGLSIVVTGALFVAMSGSGVTDSAKVNFGVQTLTGTAPSGFSLIDTVTTSNVTVSSTLGAVVASATLVERDPISIGATLAAVVSSIALRETDPLSIGATLAAVVASISLAETDTLTASPTLGPVVGAASLTMTDPLSVASTLAPVVSSIALVNGVITSDLTIGATLDPIVAAIALVNPSSAAGRPKRPKKQRYTFPNGVTVISSSYEMAKLVARYGQAEPEPEADEPEAEAPVELAEEAPPPPAVDIKVNARPVAVPDPAIAEAAARRKAEDAELFEAAQRLLALRRAEEEAILMLLLEDE